MTAQEKYLTSYRAYENLLRDAGKDPRQVEDELQTADPGNAYRPRMPRLFRNYLTHEHDPGFLVPTDMMQSFLDSEVLVLKYQNDVAKQHLKPASSAIFDQDAKIAEILIKIGSGAGKRQVIASRADGKWVLYDIYGLIAAYVSSKTPKSLKLSAAKPIRAKPAFAAPTDMFPELEPGRFIICTDDGTADGKVLGVVKSDA